MYLQQEITTLLNKDISQASNQEIYLALLQLVKNKATTVARAQSDKKLYYISAEFLIGKLLSNNLINLGIYDEVSEILKANGKDINMIEEVENEPSLGNGGLGRLAACFLDSIATLGLNGDGVGLNYHFGLFKQEFEDLKQDEQPNPWITNPSWLNDTNISFNVQFGDFSVKSHLYDIDVLGYHNIANKLHLFDIESVDESIVKDGINFDKTQIAKNLTLFLYPDDSDEQGQLLRVYQQYFMVSNAAQLIIMEEKAKGHNLKDLASHVQIQINDTHPTMIIPELIRLLMLEGIGLMEAMIIVCNTCAYTNHTILSEALEKWPRKFILKVCPNIMAIIEALNLYVGVIYTNDQVQIIDDQDRVHMARICMHFSHSINGVAQIHTEILKHSELKPFYDLYPQHFNNKTNGITFRRWLMHANHELSKYIDSLIGEGWKSNAYELEKLLQYYNDEQVLDHLDAIKHENKVALANYIQEHEGITIDPNSIYCIQIKRLHEYKRQQMNALYIIYKYFQIKEGNYPARPITIIFGAKAAPAYKTAKNIIHLILCLQKLINEDPEVSKYLKVVMVQNYNVTYATKLIPACDISEQISLASKEASGTGNMKFMLNGAVTLGTDDGANVEIHHLVGDDNIYIFGQSSDQVIAHYNNHDYVSKNYYDNDSYIRKIIDFITDEKLIAIGGDLQMLTDLKNELINKDWFMTLLDLESYCDTKERIFADYENRAKFKRMSLVNIAKAGYFSSDRTIQQYNDDIWHL